MSVKDFFIAVIKIIALFLFIEGVVVFMANTVFVVQISEIDLIIGYLAIALTFFALVLLMLARANQIVQLLQLYKGFSTERFDFSNLQAKYIFKMALTVLGLYMVFMNLPHILMNLYILVKNNINTYGFEFNSIQSTKETLYISLLYVFVGIVILSLRKSITNMFNPTSEK